MKAPTNQTDKWLQRCADGELDEIWRDPSCHYEGVEVVNRSGVNEYLAHYCCYFREEN